MIEFLSSSSYFGVVLSLAVYWLCVFIAKKTGLSFLNPLLLAIIITIAVLAITGIDYDTYNSSAYYLGWLLTPATVALAVPLYEQLQKLKDNWRAIIIGITAGTVTSLLIVFAFSLLFGFDHATYVSFLPKSITTAIGMSLSAEMGGYVSVTVAVIILTGVFGNVVGEAMLKIFRITEPVAKGVALGTASHAIGTSRAIQIGEVEGAMSSLSIVVSGMITVVLMQVFAGFI